ILGGGKIRFLMRKRAVAGRGRVAETAKYDYHPREVYVHTLSYWPAHSPCKRQACPTRQRLMIKPVRHGRKTIWWLQSF
ncbi:MAG: hypothetical protein ACRC4N_01870, partial [Gammaproteobacteria bacterium]